MAMLKKLKIYASLSKFRLSSLVVVTSGAGFICAGPAAFDLQTMAGACFGTGLCAASASTFNQVWEIDRDKEMKRTQKRPLPTGEVSKFEASTFGVTTGLAGTGLLLATTNPTVAMLGLGNIGLYAGAYTLSKPISEINTWIGSIVGAIPPVMGWVAAGGAICAPEPFALGSLLFFWQFPHFFALSWLHREDYARGGFQMVAVNDPSGSRSANLILEYSAYLTALPIAIAGAGLTSSMFAIEATAANAYLLYLANNFKNDKTNANARKIFLCSLWYLPLVLGAYLVHSKQWSKERKENAPDLSALCVHEVLIKGDKLEDTFCAKKQIENAATEVQGLTILTSEKIENKIRTKVK